MTITVFGTPAPQGSKRFLGLKNGKGILVESCRRVKPWRESVLYAAREAGVRVAGPVTVSMTFTIPKPKSAPKRRKTWPDRKPDIDKLCRSTFDGLVAGGAIEDDARIVECRARKVYPGEGVDALHTPGVVIRIETISEI